MMRLTSGRLALVAALCAAAACASEPEPATSSFTVSGVVTQDGASLAHTTVDAALWDTPASQVLVSDTVSSDGWCDKSAPSPHFT